MRNVSPKGQAGSAQKCDRALDLVYTLWGRLLFNSLVCDLCFFGMSSPSGRRKFPRFP